MNIALWILQVLVGVFFVTHSPAFQRVVFTRSRLALEDKR